MTMNEQPQPPAAEIGKASRPRLYTEHGRVYRAESGMIYLIGGSNDVAELYTPIGFDEKVDAEAWSALITKRVSATKSLGSAFAQLIVPEKLAIHPPTAIDRAKLFPGISEEDIVAPGRRLLDRVRLPCTYYPDEFLRQQSLKMPVYLPTDSHWTWKGAFSAFQIVMFGLGYSPDYSQYVQLPKIQLRYRGDLWEPEFMDNTEDQFERVKFPDSIRRIYANPLVGLKETLQLENEHGLHVGSHCIFGNPDAQFRETAIVFGSSFSEYRLAPSLLTSMFAYYFSTVHFVWSTSVDVDYVQRHKPAVVIAELPERFLTIRPADKLGVEEFSIDRLRTWKARTAERTRLCLDTAAAELPKI